MLPLLAQCTQLTRLCGEWVAAAAETGRPADVAITECPSVIALHGSGPIPFAAFKRVQRMTQWEPWQPAVFSSIAQHCRQLRNLDFHMGHAVWGTRFPASMPADAPAERRMAAIHSLAGLQQLQLLDFAVNDSAEVAALAAITQLQHCRHHARGGAAPAQIPDFGVVWAAICCFNRS